jgi:hypothetical protein
MELTKLQTIALVVLTTILTDKFLIDHNPTIVPVQNNSPTSINSPELSAQAVTSVSTSSATNAQTEIILRELVNLRKDMAASLEQSSKLTTNNSAPAPTLSASLLGGMVKINSSQWKKIDVYEKPLASSKIINSIVYDTIYFYTQKQDGWYQLNLDGGQLGWVQAQFLKEFP